MQCFPKQTGRRTGKLKRICLLTAFLLFVLATTTTAAPLKIARLPLILGGFMQPDTKTVDILETKLDRALHVPLNSVLNIVEFLPEGECETALEEIMDERRRETGKRRIKIKDVMRPLAEKLDADIVICPALTAYDEQIYPSFSPSHGMIVYANASVEISGYDKRTGKPFFKGSSRHSHDEYGARTNVAYLAAQCMDSAIEEANLREIIPSAKELIAEKNTVQPTEEGEQS